MVNVHTVRNIVGIIGNVISFGLFLSPSPTFIRICKRKSVEEFQPYPYIFTALNCLFWILYGLPFVHPDSTLVVTINGVGLVLEAIYLLIFLIYAGDNKKRLKVVMLVIAEIIFVGIIAAITMTVYHTYVKRSFFVGLFCIVFGIIMYASPLMNMWNVWKTKSVEFMPFWLSFAGFVNGIVWVIYAQLGQFDLNITIPNGMGVLLGAIQLMLWTYVGVIYPRCCAADSAEADIEMAAPKPLCWCCAADSAEADIEMAAPKPLNIV